MNSEYTDHKDAMVHSNNQRRGVDVAGDIEQSENSMKQEHSRKDDYVVAVNVSNKKQDNSTKKSPTGGEKALAECQKKLEMERANHSATVQHYTARLHEAQLENCATKERLQIMEANLREAEARATAAENRAKKIQTECQRLRTEAENSIQLLENQCATKLEQRDHQIHGLLDQITQGKVEGRWNPPPDDELRRQLRNLNTNVRNWSKDFSTKSFKPELDMTKELAVYLSRSTRIETDGSLPRTLTACSPDIRQRLAGVLLNAIVNHEIQESFFANSFFCTDAQHQAVLADILNTMLQGMYFMIEDADEY